MPVSLSSEGWFWGAGAQNIVEAASSTTAPYMKKGPPRLGGAA